MNIKACSAIRLTLQGIAAENKFEKPEDLLAHIGAIQAQDYAMAKWAIGLRLKNASESSVEKAISDGAILRTHVLRPTWHFVPAADIHWMLELTADKIKGAFRAYGQKLGLTNEIYLKAAKIMEKALGENAFLTRDALLKELSAGGVENVATQSVVLLMWAEQEGIICSGPTVAKEHSYALLANRVSKPTKITREEALSLLAARYFGSHGPATLGDYVWWSGLSVKEARQGLESIKSTLQMVLIAGEEHYFPRSFVGIPSSQAAHLLPGFDEIIISYKHKTGTLLPEHYEKVISKNAIFKPTIVSDATVVGTWKRLNKKQSTELELQWFDEALQIDLSAEEAHYAAYFDLNT